MQVCHFTISFLIAFMVKCCLDIFNGSSPWEGYIAMLFVIFIFVMTIIIMNLITGLALDDIQKIAENAEYKKLTMQVKTVQLINNHIHKIILFRG